MRKSRILFVPLGIGLAVVLGLLALIVSLNVAPQHVRAGVSAPYQQLLYSFETGVEGWTGSLISNDPGGTVEITTSHATEGDQALQLNSIVGFFSVEPAGAADFADWNFFTFDLHSPYTQTFDIFVALQTGGSWNWQESTYYTITQYTNTITVDLLNDFGGGALPSAGDVHRINIYVGAEGTYILDNVQLEGELPTPTPTLTWTPIVETPTPPAELPGFRVYGRHLYDRCGEKVVLRGVNKMVFWTDRDGLPAFPEIAKTGANIVRMVWSIDGDPAEMDIAIGNALANDLIPMIGLWDYTGEWDGLQTLVTYWTRPDVVAVLQKYEKDLLVNIGNEVGGSYLVTTDMFKEGYRLAILRMRIAGIHTPLVVDASGWGQDINILQAAGPYLLSIDPDHNLMFDVHMWWPYLWGHTDQEVIDEIHESVQMGLPLMVGEYGNKWDDTPEGAIPYRTILEQTYANEVGMMTWEWGPGNNPQTWLNMTTDGMYDTLFDWGLEVAVTSTYSILNTSNRPYSIVNGECAAGPTPTAPPSPTPYLIPPVVSIEAPAFDTVYTPSVTVTIQVTATDEDGSVALVEFFANGYKLGEDDTAPYTFEWANVPVGDYTLTARAVDDTGVSSISLPSHIIIMRPLAFWLNDSTTGSGLYQFNYTGGWNIGTGVGKYHSDDHYTSDPDAYVEFRFEGNRIYLFGGQASHHGDALVSIDDGVPVTVTYYSTNRAENVLLWTSPDLGPGEHTLRVENTSSDVVTVDRVMLSDAAVSLRLPVIYKDTVNEPMPTKTPTATLPATATLPSPTRTPYPTSTPTTPPPPEAPYILFDFETGDDGWVSGVVTTTVQQTTTNATNGTYALAINGGIGGFARVQPSTPLDLGGYRYLKFDINAPDAQTIKFYCQTGRGWDWHETSNFPVPAGNSTVTIDLTQDFSGPLPNANYTIACGIWYNAGLWYQDYFRLEERLPQEPVVELYDFETGVEGWTSEVVTTTLSQTTTNATHGTYALAIDGDLGGWARVSPTQPLDLSGYRYFMFDVYAPISQTVDVYFQTGNWGWHQIDAIQVITGQNTVVIDLLNDFSGALPDAGQVLSMGVYYNAGLWFQDHLRVSSEEVVYDDATTWDNWSWDAIADTTNITPVYTGTHSISVTITGANGAMSLRTATPVTTEGYRELVFWIHGGESGTRELDVFINTSDSGGESPKITISVPAGGWMEVRIPLSDFGSPAQIARINIADHTGAPQPTFYVDEIELVGP